MNAKVVGTQDLDFKTKEGNQIKGVNLYVTYIDDAVYGLKAEKFFVNNTVTLPADLKPGMEVMFVFNRYGKVDGVMPVSNLK